jgi:hypothetical protein
MRFCPWVAIHLQTMRTLEAVPVFYLEQDSSCDAPCKSVSRAEAREMKKGGAGWFIDHGKAFRLAGRTPITASSPVERAGSLETAATISKAEMLANVGIFERLVRNEREATRRAQAKIRIYPFIVEQPFLVPSQA